METNVDTSEQPFHFLSFCPGILGLERGVERAGLPINIVSYVEIEAFAIANLVAGMESGILAPRPIWTDVKTFPAFRFRNKVDGIFGGYPCQPYSIIGKQTGDEHEQHIWPAIRSAYIATGAWILFFENVVHHLTVGYEQVKRELEEDGYTVKEGIHSAVETGAPHRRERLFIMAIRMDHCGRERLERYAGDVFGKARQENGGGGDWINWRVRYFTFTFPKPTP